MIGVLMWFCVIQSIESRDDLERIFGFLERQPKTVHATGTYFAGCQRGATYGVIQSKWAYGRVYKYISSRYETYEFPVGR